MRLSGVVALQATLLEHANRMGICLVLLVQETAEDAAEQEPSMGAAATTSRRQ